MEMVVQTCAPLVGQNYRGGSSHFLGLMIVVNICDRTEIITLLVSPHLNYLSSIRVSGHHFESVVFI